MSSPLVPILLYSVCSGTLLLLNKLLISYIPLPALMTLVQLLSAVGFVYFLKVSKISEVDDMVMEKMIPYGYYALAFVFGVYSNMKALAVSNVETVIVFRALSPLAVSVLDYVFLGRELPNTRSLAALTSVVIGAIIYVVNDAQFAVMGFAAYRCAWEWYFD